MRTAMQTAFVARVRRVAAELKNVWNVLLLRDPRRAGPTNVRHGSSPGGRSGVTTERPDERGGDAGPEWWVMPPY